jgi:hypothetical protein
MDNLDLWNAVERTDPSHTKAITGKAYQGTSPKPHYLVRKATETFGPCGIGWGFEIADEKLLDGALLDPGFFERIHMARVRVWYEWDGKRGTIEHVGQTVFCGKRKDGKPFTDEDAPKKSVTDALVKALSMIGFAGDIFMGRFDDSKYVNDVRREIADQSRAGDDRQRPQLVASRADPLPTESGAADHLIELISHARSEVELSRLTNAPANIDLYETMDAVDQDRISAALTRQRGTFRRVG